MANLRIARGAEHVARKALLYCARGGVLANCLDRNRAHATYQREGGEQ